jgi:protein-disulfide isomerase
MANYDSSNSLLAREPSIALSAAEHSLGNADAPLKLLEYSDYECPECAAAEAIVENLITTFPKELRFVFRHFPLVEAQTNAEFAF